jgi:hypothetical protein
MLTGWLEPAVGTAGENFGLAVWYAPSVGGRLVGVTRARAARRDRADDFTPAGPPPEPRCISFPRTERTIMASDVRQHDRQDTAGQEMTPEETVRAFFAAYSGHPERLDEVVSPDYVDYGHTPPGRGPQGAHDDYEHNVRVAGGPPTYEIDSLIARGDIVAVDWTGHLPNGSEIHRLSMYRVADGRVAETRHPQ